jgi:hypothetical protein
MLPKGGTARARSLPGGAANAVHGDVTSAFALSSTSHAPSGTIPSGTSTSAAPACFIGRTLAPSGAGARSRVARSERPPCHRRPHGDDEETARHGVGSSAARTPSEDTTGAARCASVAKTLARWRAWNRGGSRRTASTKKRVWLGLRELGCNARETRSGPGLVGRSRRCVAFCLGQPGARWKPGAFSQRRLRERPLHSSAAVL